MESNPKVRVPETVKAVSAAVNTQETVEFPSMEQSGDSSDLYLSSWRLIVVIVSLCFGTFLVALDINIIGVAVPEITTTFNSLQDAAWYGSAYLLTVTAFQPTMGFLYKYFNVQVTYLVCIVTFEGDPPK